MYWLVLLAALTFPAGGLTLETPADKRLLDRSGLTYPVLDGGSPEVIIAGVEAFDCCVNFAPPARAELKLAGALKPVLVATVNSSKVVPPTSAVPPEIAEVSLVNARRVYLSNQSTDRKAFDELVRIIRRWGRWELVDGLRQADLHAIFFDKASVSPSTNVGPVLTTPGPDSYKLPSSIDRRALKLISTRDGRQLLVVRCKDLKSAGANAKAIFGLLRMEIEKADEQKPSKP